MAARDLLRSRLALRIYLTGLTQVAVVAAGFFAILFSLRPQGRPPMFDHAEVAIERLRPVLEDRAALVAQLAQLSAELDADLAVIGPDGADVAASPDGASLRCPQPPRPMPPAPGGPPCVVFPLELPSGIGALHMLLRAPPSPPSLATRVVPLVLLVVGVSSLLLAGSLLRPLRRMSAAARSLGAGDLNARVGLTSKDELGDVARAFDDMAERMSVLLRAEKELLANVSHELRTPLARIRVALELAAEGDSATAREALTDIADDLDELERLLSDVLTAARLDLGEGPKSGGLPPLRLAEVDPRVLVTSAAQRFAGMNPGRRLRETLAEGLPMLHADPVLLRRMLENLLSNAHKYTEDASAPVEIAARNEDGKLVVEVVDTGIGIAESDLPFVFRPFFRADRSRTRATGGIGLGLALAKSIVDAHGGTIAMESKVGQGTRVTVTIPPVLGGVT